MDTGIDDLPERRFLSSTVSSTSIVATFFMASTISKGRKESGASIDKFIHLHYA